MKELAVSVVFRVMNWDELANDTQTLLGVAIMARMKARPLQSHFMVGAAIRSESGLIFPGCNIEDIGHNMTIHAESGAFGAMVPVVAPDERISEVAIALGMENTPVEFPPRRNGPEIEKANEITYTPCGHCRQLLGHPQYQPKDRPAMVYALQPNGQILVTNLKDLYPLGFNI